MSGESFQSEDFVINSQGAIGGYKPQTLFRFSNSFKKSRPKSFQFKKSWNNCTEFYTSVDNSGLRILPICLGSTFGRWLFPALLNRAEAFFWGISHPFHCCQGPAAPGMDFLAHGVKRISTSMFSVFWLGWDLSNRIPLYRGNGLRGRERLQEEKKNGQCQLRFVQPYLC